MRRVSLCFVFAVSVTGAPAGAQRKGANVRQLWQASRDDGKTWNVLFDGLYVPAKSR